MRMLLTTRPGHRGPCARARQGCTCFYLPNAYGRRAKVLRRSVARAAEARTWRRDPDAAVLANVRVLSEGVDLRCESVVFADPKASVVEIVQAIGRALRQNLGEG